MARWEAVNDAGAAGPRLNEDLVEIFERDSTTDVLVLDGATSLVADEGIAGGNGDVAWFVRRFADAFGRALDAGVPRAGLLAAAAEATARAWDERTEGVDLPPWAWPVASLSWVRVTASGASWLTSLGDCKALLRLPDGVVRDLDPFDNAQEVSLYAEVAALRDAGVTDPVERFRRMLPSLRARRTAQNTAPAPVVLGACPQGPFAVRETAFDAPPGSVVLAMSDGFWRLVDPYGLVSSEALLDACAAAGLAPLLFRLRDFEAGSGGSASLAVKRADDASAVALYP